MCQKRKSHPNRDGFFLFFFCKEQDSNLSKCNADERCPLRLDAAESLFSFASARKCKSSPADPIIRKALLFSSSKAFYL